MSDSVTPWTETRQSSLSITNSQSFLKLMSIESVMPSNHLILCHPLLLLPSIFPSIRVSSNESVLRIRWPKYWSFSFSISPSNECSGLISFRKLGLTGWISLQSKGLSRVFSNTTDEQEKTVPRHSRKELSRADTLILTVWDSYLILNCELWDNKLVLIEAAKFVTICFSNNS